MGRWAALQAQVQTAVGSTTAADAQSWLLESARRLNAEAKFLTARVSLGNTVAGTGTYAVAGTVVDLDSVRVGGQPYARANINDMEALEAGNGYVTGYGGFFAPDYDATGGQLVAIWPVPTVSGQIIDGRQVIQIPAPSSWATDDPALPAEADAGIRYGALAVGLSLQDEQLAEAQAYMAMFDAEVVKLRSRKLSKIGSGGVRLKVPARDR